MRLGELFAAYLTSPEIRAQIEALKKALSVPLPVLWLGMGASFASSLAGATSLLMAGRASFVLEASEWLHYAGSVKLQTAPPILVTTSGVSAELVELTRRAGPNPLIVLCNQNDSPCWAAADIRFPILAGPERANATKTYVNSAAACIILACELTGREWQAEVEQVAKDLPEASKPSSAAARRWKNSLATPRISRSSGEDLPYAERSWALCAFGS